MQQIQFFNLFPARFLSHRGLLKQFLSQQLQKNGKAHHKLHIIFCDDEYLLNMNRDHLEHDYYTDIITFDLSDPQDDAFLLGELYISVERVIDNAKSSDLPLQPELLRVIFHGILHLLGYKDKTPKDIKLMRSKEDEWISLYQTYASLC